MADETLDLIDLDLNLDPVPEEEISGVIRSEAVDLDDIDGETEFSSIRGSFRHENQQRERWRRVRLPYQSSFVELNQLMTRSGNESRLQTGEGSVAVEERRDEGSKTCENDKGFLEGGDLDMKDNDEKSCVNDESYFDCNICFDLAREPVVTSCGHLFCWPCLYKWLNVYSDAKECPVCKGEVTEKNVVPIYGRGGCVRHAEEDSSLKVPPRPDAQRTESWRQNVQGSMFSSSMEEMFRRLNGGHDFTRDVSPPNLADLARETAERTHSVVNSILSRTFWRARPPVQSPTDIVDLVQEQANVESRQQLLSMFPRRFQSYRGSRTGRSHFFDVLGNAVTGRNQEQHPSVNDRDSFSSVAGAYVPSGYLPAPSSRRRTNASRTSNVDSRDTRAQRRRRMN